LNIKWQIDARYTKFTHCFTVSYFLLLVYSLTIFFAPYLILKFLGLTTMIVLAQINGIIKMVFSFVFRKVYVGYVQGIWFPLWTTQLFSTPRSYNFYWFFCALLSLQFTFDRIICLEFFWNCFLRMWNLCGSQLSVAPDISIITFKWTGIK